MNARFFKNSFSRVIVSFMILNFMLTSGPVGTYSEVFAAGNFRKSQTRGTDAGSDIINALGSPSKSDGGGLNLRTLDSIRNKGLKSGFTVVDWNVGGDMSGITDDTRISKTLDLFRSVLGPNSEAEEVYVTTHWRRPDEDRTKLKGEGKTEEEILKYLLSEYSLAPVVAKAQALFAKDDILKDAALVLLPFNLDDEAAVALAMDKARAANKGKKIVFVFENIRIYEAEKSKDAAQRKTFEEKLIRLTGKTVDSLFYVNEAFDKLHRPEEASMEMVLRFPAQNRSAGLKLQKDLKNVLAFEQAIKGGSISFLFGGAKFDKYKNVGSLAKRVADTKGKLVIVGAQVNEYLISLGRSVGKSKVSKDKDKDAVKKGITKINDSGADVLVPVDFVVKDGDAIKTVVADELGGSMSQIDIGPKSIDLIVLHILSLKPGDGMVLNGGAGIFENKESWEGTKRILMAVNEVADRTEVNGMKAVFFLAGGDMVAAANKFKEETGIDLLAKVFSSTGGGSLLEVLGKGPEKMPLVDALIDKSAPAQASADGGSGMPSRALYFVNNIDLGKGAETGSKGWWYALLEKADGIILNHSEMRLFYEKIVDSGLRNVLVEVRSKFFDYDREIKYIEKWEKDQRDGVHSQAKKGRLENGRKSPTLDTISEEANQRKANALQKKQEWDLVAKKLVVGLDGKSGLFGYLKTTTSLEEKDLGVKIGEGAIDKTTKLVVDWDKVELGRFTAWLEELGRKAGDERARIDGFSYGSEDALLNATLEMVTRRIVNKIMRELFVQALEIKNRRPSFEIVLCHGETLAQFNDKRSAAVCKQDMLEILEGITEASFVGAYEPRFAIGTGLVPSDEHITNTQLIIKVTIIEKLGKEMPELYGGSADKNNARRFFSLKPQEVTLTLPGATIPVQMVIRPVNGALIGGAGLEVGKIEPMIRIAEDLKDETGEAFYIYMNHKAYNPSTGLAASVYEHEFADMFKTVDFSKVHVAIGSPTPATVREMIQGPLDKLIGPMMVALKTTVSSLASFFKANKEIYDATAGKDYEAAISSLFSPQVSAETIQDSAGKDTVKATVTIGAGLTTTGEVPAGASTGYWEARLEKNIELAKKLVGEISGLLAKNNFDLRKHEDLIRAEELIAKESNKYEKYPANAVVPVSWALWRMAAKLNNMDLWEYFREKVPGIVGEDTVDFMVNIFNGGLHALLTGELLGRDRMDIQETLLVPVGGKNAREKRKMSDKVDKVWKKILVDEYGAENVTRAREAGFTVKGLGQFDVMMESLRKAIRLAGYEEGKDFQISLDVAATSFAEKQSSGAYLYNFQGKIRTTEQMIEYYVELVKKYPGLIRSVEDGLAEDDWDGWFALTEEMTKLGVITIGDDLFVTQMDRLTKGIRIGADGKIKLAASGILIKVNQNGNVWGTLQVMELAQKYGIKIVVSHRSGETLDDGIADLAYAANAWAIKTGDTQPEYDFPDESTWVRRVKYLRLAAIELGKRALKILTKEQRVLIVTDSFVPTATEALSQLSSIPNLKLMIVGENAKKMKTLLGNDAIITAKTADEALGSVYHINIDFKNIVYLRSPQDPGIIKYPGVKELTHLKEVLANEIGTLSVLKALQGLFGNSVADEMFKTFAQKIDGKVITSQTQNDMEALLAQLKQGTFVFSAGVKVTETAMQKITEAKKKIEIFGKEI
jgi:enolase